MTVFITPPQAAAAFPSCANESSHWVAAVVVTIWRAIGETIPAINALIPAVTCDPKDDYLLAHAVVGRADFLVTGDSDLLILDRVEALRIVTAGELVRILRGEPE